MRNDTLTRKGTGSYNRFDIVFVIRMFSFCGPPLKHILENIAVCKYAFTRAKIKIFDSCRLGSTRATVVSFVNTRVALVLHSSARISLVLLVPLLPHSCHSCLALIL